MNPLIRTWNYDDANAIARLNHQWGYPASTEEISQRLKELSSTPNNELFIAETDSKVVGWLHVYRHFTMGDDAFAEIGGLVVDTEFRQKGVGKMLVERAKEWMQKHGMTILRVRTNIKREEANVFYAKCGFKLAKQQNVFEIRL